MRKPYRGLLLLALLVSMQSLAAGINFIENKSWKEVLALAKKERKLIFLDAYATWCGPCKYLQKDVFTDDAVGKFYNANFINVKIDMEEGEGVSLAERYGVTSYPTLFFIDGDGQLVHKSIGAMEAEDFIGLGRDASDPEKQYYTVKRKALDGKLNPELFHNWVHSAESMEDEEADDVIQAYLSNTDYPLLQEDMVSIIIDHAQLLSKTQLDQLFRNKAQAAKLIDADGKAFDNALVKLVAAYASSESVSGETMDFAKFQKIVAGYFPQAALVETQKVKVSWYVASEDAPKAMAALSELIKSPNVGVTDMAMAVVDATNIIVEANKGKEYLAKVEAFKVKVADAKQSFYKDLALAMLHYRMSNTEKLKFYVNKISKDENAPEAIVQVVQGLLEEEGE